MFRDTDPVGIYPYNKVSREMRGVQSVRERGGAMSYVLIHHKVENIDGLRSMFEEDSMRRRASGSKGARLFRDPADSTLAVALLEFEDVERAQRFAESTQLRELIGWAGDHSDVKPEVIEEFVSLDA